MTAIEINAERLLHRRQFLIAPRPCAELAHWTNTKLADDLFAHTHPELTLTQASVGGTRLVLFGYMIDAYRPELGNVEILTSLAALDDRNRIIRGTFPLAGRWALLVLGHDHRTFINDAFGLRQLVYTVSGQNGNWYASDAKLIADLLHLRVDPAAQAFLDLIKVDMGMREYYFPYNLTRYADKPYAVASGLVSML